MIKNVIVTIFMLLSTTAMAASNPGDILVKFKPGAIPALQDFNTMVVGGGAVEALGDNWMHVQVGATTLESDNTEDILTTLRSNPAVEFAQPNYTLSLIEDYQVKDPASRQILEDLASGKIIDELVPNELFGNTMASAFPPVFKKGKPTIPAAFITPEFGPDPLVSNQWNMRAIHAPEAWKVTPGNKKIIVAVIDTGVDYTHEDLQGNIWHNPGEIPGDGIDNDGNGFVDDVIGWDFADNDNKPYDVKGSIISTLLAGGNPGHGTHCAGNVGAVGNNSIGISGVAPNISIMPLRFIDASGKGTTAQAVRAINYAVQNGAKVLSNSWGSEGEDPHENNQALKDAIKNAMNHDVLFVAAAGNGHSGRGYDNDTDPKPSVPASYKYNNIVSVAATDSNNNLASFSNWGKTTVHVAAPGVAIYSTIEGNKYSDAVFKISSLKIAWDGTSMAAPQVAGAAALVWSAHPDYKYTDVKAALIKTVTPLDTMNGKSVSGGLINVAAAIK